MCAQDEEEVIVSREKAGDFKAWMGEGSVGSAFRVPAFAKASAGRFRVH